jgi:dolichol-phosphate mannosyltransferase
MEKENLVIIPTYNEIDNVERIIRKVFSLPYPFEVLIIDDGSPDGTAQIVKDLQKEFEGKLHLEQRTGKLGLGTAYIHGFKYALARGYKYIFEMDADFSHPPDELLNLYKVCKVEGFDMAVGSRYVNNVVNVINWPMERVLMSYFASKYVRFITGIPVFDTTAGFVCYKAEVLETLLKKPIKFVGYAFQIEMKFKTWKYGFKIKEIPIVFTDRTLGVSKMSNKIFKEAFFGVIELKISSWFTTFNR